MKLFCNMLQYVFPLLVAFPKLFALKLLQWCLTSDTFHFSFAVLGLLFGNGELPASRCCRSILLQNVPPQSPQVATVVIRAHGAQIFGRVQEEHGSNVDNQLAHEIALPKSHGLPLEAVRALITNKGSFRPVGHLWVAGCKACVAISKELVL